MRAEALARTTSSSPDPSCAGPARSEAGRRENGVHRPYLVRTAVSLAQRTVTAPPCLPPLLLEGHRCADARRRGSAQSARPPSAPVWADAHLAQVPRPPWPRKSAWCGWPAGTCSLRLPRPLHPVPGAAHEPVFVGWGQWCALRQHSAPDAPDAGGGADAKRRPRPARLQRPAAPGRCPKTWASGW